MHEKEIVFFCQIFGDVIPCALPESTIVIL